MEVERVEVSRCADNTGSILAVEIQVHCQWLLQQQPHMLRSTRNLESTSILTGKVERSTPASLPVYRNHTGHFSVYSHQFTASILDFLQYILTRLPYLVSRSKELKSAPVAALRSPFVRAPKLASRLATAAAKRRSPPRSVTSSRKTWVNYHMCVCACAALINPDNARLVVAMCLKVFGELMGIDIV